MRWQVRWSRNAVLGVLPFADSFRNLKRHLRPPGDNIPEWTLEEGLKLISMLRGAGCSLKGMTVLEVGSGWRPIIPLLYFLAGVERVVMVDEQRLMGTGSFLSTVRGLTKYASSIAAELGIEESAVRTALTCPPQPALNDLLQQFHMEYLAPCDLITSSLPEHGFDIVTSRAVLEHVPLAVLSPLLTRTFDLLKSGGWACHAIDNSDHYSHVDSRLSRVNFLRYSDRQFGLLNRFNRLDFQNRLRHRDYERMFVEVGFELILACSQPEPQAIADLKSLPLAPRFQGLSPEELSCLDSYFVLRRPEIVEQSSSTHERILDSSRSSAT